MSASQQGERCADACHVHTELAREAGWLRAAAWAKALAWMSLVWMCAEGALGLWQGFAVGSIVLVGWALGSAVEGLASVIVVWRFTGARTLSQTAERWAQKAVAVSFWLLAPYIAVEAIRDLIGGHRAETTVVGLVLAASSLFVMPALGYARRRLGARLGRHRRRGCAELPVRRPGRRRAHWPWGQRRLAQRLVARPGDRAGYRRLVSVGRHRILARRGLLLKSWI
ncbi:MAG TPA: hypothetical protein VE155_13445 [Pseudonocardiaceae bacterium]|jgi:hypothetical protein|nr:hypothetical protein [Pseudonocardiaceae bacterium]